MADYKVLGRDVVYTGRAFNVQKVHYELPNGKQRDYDLVDHSRAVTIIPLCDAGIIFVRQYRVGAEGLLLELPAGMVEADEMPLACAEREVREETGMQAAEMQELGHFFMVAGYSNEEMFVYLAPGLTQNPLKADDDEFLAVEIISVEKVFAMIHQNEIHDAKTLAALLLALPAFEKRQLR